MLVEGRGVSVNIPSGQHSDGNVESRQSQNTPLAVSDLMSKWAFQRLEAVLKERKKYCRFWSVCLLVCSSAVVSCRCRRQASTTMTSFGCCRATKSSFPHLSSAGYNAVT
jgi:hypothetical protein